MDRRTPQVVDDVTNETPGVDDVSGCDERPLHPDAEKVERFAASNFTSPEFHVWFKDIFDTVAAWLDAWTRSEEVYRRLATYRSKPIDLDPSAEERHALRVRHSEREDLVADAVNTARSTFIDKVLRAKQWDPRGGSSVRSYFMRAALFQFATAFRRWQRRRANEAQRFDKLVRQYSPFAADDVAGQFETDEQIERLLQIAETDQDRSIMLGLLEGQSERSIAESNGLQSPKRVRTIKNHMRKAYKQFEGGPDA